MTNKLTEPNTYEDSDAYEHFADLLLTGDISPVDFNFTDGIFHSIVVYCDLAGDIEKVEMLK